MTIYLIRRSGKYFSSFQAKLFEFVKKTFASDTESGLNPGRSVPAN